MEEIDTAVEHVHKRASFEQRQHDRDHTMASAIDLGGSDDSMTTFPCYEMPPPNPKFLGRNTELNEMADFLDPSRCTQSLSSCIVHGLGGIGKSALALAYAARSRHNDTYDAIFWIQSETLISLRNSYSDMALRLELTHVSSATDIENNTVRFRNWLNKTKKRWLLIFDNVDNVELLRKFLPSAPGPMILTTRFNSLAFGGLGRLNRLELMPFEADESMQLFNMLRLAWDPNADVEGEQGQTEELLKDLGGLSLAIEQMSAYIGTRCLTIREFLVKYERMSRHILKTHDGDDPDRASRSHSVATVWEMHFVAIQDTEASEILSIMALISPDAIPIDLFLPEGDVFGSELWSIDNEAQIALMQSRVEEGVDMLARNALIKRSGNSLSLHRLVQKAYRNSVLSVPNGDLQKTWNIAVELTYQAFPKRSFGRTLTNDHQQCAKYLPHAVSLTDIWYKSQNTREQLQSTKEFVELIDNFTTYQFEMGPNQETLEYLDIGFLASQDKGSSIYAQMKEQAAKIYQEFNDAERCKDACFAALAIFDKLYEPDNLYSALVRSHLANAFADEGAYDTALHYHETAASVQARAGEEALENLALSYLSMGRLYFLKVEKDRARKYLDMAQAAFAAGGGDVARSPYAASLLRCQADLAFSDGSPERAVEIIDKALRIYEAISQTSDTIISYYYKKGYYQAHLSRFDDALLVFNKALAIAQHQEDLGEQARLLRQRGLLINRNPASSEEDRRKAERDLAQASLMAVRITEGKAQFAFPPRSEDEAYNRLVCISSG